jgi:hypothetical protein
MAGERPRRKFTVSTKTGLLAVTPRAHCHFHFIDL